MSENGGPVFEGVGRPEKQRVGIVERVKTRIESKINGVRREVDTRKNNAQEIQARIMDRYAKVVSGMNESLLKTAYQKIEPVIRLKAIAKGVSAGVYDISVGTLLNGTRFALDVLAGFSFGEAIKNPNGRVKSILIGLGLLSGAQVARVVSQKTADIRPIHEIRRKAEDARDFVGLKGVDILNKIIGRKPQAIPMAG